ncbi:hypothetical protein LVJ94_17475 [Pendulispora rubella]|uniref:Peptidase M43 pregnancy-associated plasma-A domain-containing protein n=1 Tax=Pendulispora rubella TaxID=2741070 RepID=A0ABZ2LF58_9BACT
MGIPLSVYGERRVVLLRWRRARHGDPHLNYPDVDNRATRAPELAPVVGIQAGEEAVVRLERRAIDPNAELHVVSSDKGKVDVVLPADGKVPSGPHADIRLSGVSGGNPNEVKLEVRFGSATGPIVSILIVRCFSRRRVVMTPHLVTIAGPTGAGGIASTANVAAIMSHVRAIWRHCGVDFTINATVNDTLNFASPGVVSDTPFPGEVATLLSTNWVPNSINAYFVQRIGAGGTLGYGFSRPSSVTFALPNPGIILADRAGPAVHDTAWAGNDLAHEAGHFFQLWHPNNQQPPTEREDTWSRRMLMHNFNTQPIMSNWKDDNGYGAIGGSARRGALVTHKDIPAIATDRECTTARNAIVAGPY